VKRRKGQPFTHRCAVGLRLSCVYTPLRGAAHKKQTTQEVALLRRVVILLFAPLLGSVKWHFKKLQKSLPTDENE